MILQPPAVAPAAIAAPALRTVTRPASRVFPFLDLYYRLDPARRTRFSVAYRWRAVASGGAWRPVAATLAVGEVSVAVPHSPLGWFDRVPTVQELAAHPVVRLEAPAGERLSMILAPQLEVRRGAAMDPAEIVAAAEEFERGVHAAGPLAVVVPRFVRVLFVGGEGASLVDAQGRATPIAPVKGELFAPLAALRAAAAVRFEVAPERVLLLPG